MLHIFKQKSKPPFKGIIRARAVPFEKEEEYLYWWPRFSEREKERYTIYASTNTITDLGTDNINSFYYNSSTVAGFSLYFAVGVNALNGVLSSDNSLAGEVFRKVPTSHTVVGNVITVTTLFTGTEGGHSGTNPVTYTNSGLFGRNATGTSGSGDLNTHSMYSFTKPYGTSISNDYAIDRT